MAGKKVSRSKTNLATFPAAKPVKSYLPKQEREEILSSLQFIFDNAHKALDPRREKIGRTHMIKAVADGIREELATRPRHPGCTEVLNFPGLILDASILDTMETTHQQGSNSDTLLCPAAQLQRLPCCRGAPASRSGLWGAASVRSPSTVSPS